MCDAFYGVIENKSFKQQCECQKDWENIMSSCKDISVTSMKQDLFYNWEFVEEDFVQNRYFFFCVII